MRRSPSYCVAVAATLASALAAPRAVAEFQIADVAQSAPVAALPFVAEPERQAAPRPRRPYRPVAPRPSGPPLAQGFGKAVPLAVAAEMIVPPGVGISVDDDVDLQGTLVDWQGGRAWPEVLRTALRPAGLQVTVIPGRVLITRASRS